MPRVRGEGGNVKLSRTPTRRIFDESDYGGERKKKEREREEKRRRREKVRSDGFATIYEYPDV